MRNDPILHEPPVFQVNAFCLPLYTALYNEILSLAMKQFKMPTLRVYPIDMYIIKLTRCKYDEGQQGKVVKFCWQITKLNDI